MNKEFILREKINESSTTVVYRAYDETLQRPVLVKILRDNGIRDETIRRRFEREARSLAAVHSEYIVQVYELTTIQGAPAIVMEYVEGESLAETLEREGKLSPARVKDIAIDILKALTIVHRRGIIHRDIKPGNIILSKQGMAKLTDFGLASVASMPTVTADGAMLGTPAYMSPEQARGEQLDATTDLFSFGLTLFEALTGKRLCEGSTPMECLRRIMNFQSETLENAKASLPSDFFPFLRKLLAPKSKDRFQSAEEALQELGVTVPSEGKKEKLWTVFTIAGFFILLVGGVLWLLTKPSSEKNHSMQETFSHTNSLPDTVHQSVPSVPEVRRTKKDSFPTVSVSVNRESSDATLSSDSVLLSIICKPWGKVFVDNEYVGETPLSKPLWLRTGDHWVVVQHPHFVPVQKNIHLTAEQKRETLSVDFLAAAGYLMVTVAPWGKIFVDDQYRETTPLTSPLLVSHGKRVIRCEHPAFKSIEREIFVHSQETTYLSIDMKNAIVHENER